MAAVVQTPQRSLPGGFVNTPAPPPPTIFASQAASLRQHTQPSTTDHATTQPGAPPAVDDVQRAAQTINNTLAAEARFPELESYVGQGMSGEYEMPQNAAWEPFQKLKEYDIPVQILQQANQAQSSSQLGVFPAINHCFATLDHCLYLWDYTTPVPEIIGFEDAKDPITAVTLVAPKPGVFVKEITHLIVVATQNHLTLLGVATPTTSTGARTVSLYNTRMSIQVSGMNVSAIRASKKSGRIFFLDGMGEDLYEFQYQQEEGWFRGRTARVCHTRSSYDFVPAPVKAVGTLFGPRQTRSKLVEIVIDDTRDILYTLSNRDELKIWTVKKKNDQVELAISRPLSSLLQTTGHFTGRTDLLYGPHVRIEKISAIPATEASKLCLMAVTNTGVRLYISATRGYGNAIDSENAPTSVQILHIRFPPKGASTAATASPPPNSGAGSTSVTPYSAPVGNIDTSTKELSDTFGQVRFPPGYFFAFQNDLNASGRRGRLFCSAPDFGRLKNPADTSALSTRFVEYGQWMSISAGAIGIYPVTPDFEATATPIGFGNEMAVQYDKPSAEFAIMTDSGVQTLRRRRLVDVFATMLRSPSTDGEGVEDELKKFIRVYGRGETAATALAVACGQGLDAPQDNVGRVSSVTEPDVIEGARRAFIEQGGKPDYNANVVLDRTADPVESVRPSPRHEGLALYISRLVRSIWPAKIIKEVAIPGQPIRLVCSVRIEKLRDVQKDLNALSDFLDRNKSFIEGLAGASALGRLNNRQDEIALQGEHRAMNSLVVMIKKIVEGIAFVLVLFDERIEEILATLSEDHKKAVLELRFEDLFTLKTQDMNIGKVLVRSIVNRNIVNGSNVETVAEALRRRCGSFCSAEDVIVFKAQEQISRSKANGAQTEAGRVLLNESQRLLSKVAGALGDDVVTGAIKDYVEAQFYAGAIQLCLDVAQARDRAKLALKWLQDGQPVNDNRESAFQRRKFAYHLIFEIINALDQATANIPETNESGQHTLAFKRRNEAYEVINSSEDAVFQSTLFGWYIENGRAQRLLEIDSKHVVDYLKRRSEQDRDSADLLWRYYAHHNDYLQAAATQLALARGYFSMSLDERIQYLSRARTNASTRQTALMDSRQSKQQLLRDIGDLLEVANIQHDLLQKLRGDPRLTDARREEVVRTLEFDGLQPVTVLFNDYSDQAEYHDINLLIYQVADHRNPSDIQNSWTSLVQTTHDRALSERAIPWEAVGEKVREMGKRLGLSDSIFPVQFLLPLMEKYAFTPQEPAIPQNWAIDLFLALEVPYELLISVLEQVYYGNEHPFQGRNRRIIAAHMVYVISQWVEESENRGDRMTCGSEENAALVHDCLTSLMRGRDLVEGSSLSQAQQLVAKVEGSLRPPERRKCLTMAQTGFHRLSHGHRDLVLASSYNFYGDRLATASSDHRVRVWDRDDKTNQWIVVDTWTAHDAEVTDIKWNGPFVGEHIGTIGEDGLLRIWQEDKVQAVNSGKRFRKIFEQTSATGVPYMSLDFKNIGTETYLAVITRDGYLTVSEPEDHESLAAWRVMWPDYLCKTPSRTEETGFRLSWHKEKLPAWPAVLAGLDRKSLSLAVAVGDVVRVVRTDKDRKFYNAALLEGAKKLVRDVSWANGSMRGYDLIATASKDGFVRIYELHTPGASSLPTTTTGPQRPADTQSAHSDSPVSRPARSGIGAGLAGGARGRRDESGAVPGAVKQDVKLAAELACHGSAPWRLAWSSAADLLVSSGDDGLLRMWRRSVEGKWMEAVEVDVFDDA
ncbi:Non-repetitive/WGA-negative nucleoporin C-terminal [Teratosphaeria destructans]|uniref:Non-repetitive/WGA-negative nucleoporin C-terminal n=1 Tax=Teratosphaeria destructans TaxID=418781 RepID=A0A9W7W049_9PEZI|nr:Non-repetitive/WGA-negative nucleoporin C-terminal [Teratosphaeria destructans]